MSIQRIDQLIWSIDDEEGILEYKLPNGLSIWLLMRYVIYTTLLRKTIREYKAPGSKGVTAKKLRPLKKNLNYLLNSYTKDPLSINKRFDCVNICSTLACVPSADGFKNRISGFLNDLDSIDVLNLIKSDGGLYRKKYAGTYRFYDFIFLKEAIKQKLSFKNKKKDPIAVDDFLNLLRTKLKTELTDADLASITEVLKYYALIAAGVERSIRRVLAHAAPKLVIIEDGNYGSLDACTIAMLTKRIGIKTAEIQHGVFDVGYQYSDKLIGHTSFAMHKTDYILGFGEYFSQFIHSSSKNITIGNQFLEMKVQELPKKNNPSSLATILFITQRDFTDNIIPILQDALRTMRNKFKLIIRLHPSDPGSKGKYSELTSLAPTEFSAHEDIYELIGSADYILGSYSTTLYESLFFGKTPIVHENELSRHFVPGGMGIRFKTAMELKLILEAAPAKVLTETKEYYWKTGCEKNFMEFYNTEVLAKKQQVSLTTTS
jgi:hypothetical protein